MIIGTENGEELVQTLRAEGIEAAVIGRLTEGKKILVQNGKIMPLEQPKSDALYEAKLPEQA